MTLLGYFLLVVLFLVAVLLILVILVQEESGEGLGSMFAGSTAAQYGARKGNVVTRITGIMAAIFMGSALLLAWINRSPSADLESLSQSLNQDTSQVLEWWSENDVQEASSSEAGSVIDEITLPTEDLPPSEASDSPPIQ